MLSIYIIDTIVFDNSHSYLRSKKLRYWVSLSAEQFTQDIESTVQENTDNTNTTAIQEDGNRDWGEPDKS